MINKKNLPINFWMWVFVGTFLIFMGFINDGKMFSFEFVYGLIALLMAFFASNDKDIENLEKRIKKLEKEKL